MKISPLKILLNSKYKVGVGRKDGMEIIPYTPYVANKYAPNQKILHPPKRQTVDSKFTDLLRPYQIDDLELLISRRSSANFSEPRTGKTPTAIRLFQAKGLNKILIVAPASSLYQWKNEFFRWSNKNAEVITGTLTAKKKKEILQSWGAETTAIIVSYDSLKLVQRQGKTTGLLSEISKHKDIEGIIVDEVHRIRNPKTLQAKALFSLRYIPEKHVLTGTPAHGRLHDLYSILHFLYPDIFTGYWRFIDYYFNKHEEYAGPQSYTVIDGLKNNKELPQFINRISVMHKRKEIMKWLPEKNIIEVKLPLSKIQQKHIKELEEEFETAHIIVENTLTQLIRVRQIANSTELVDLKESSPKIEWLKQFITDYPEKPIIIFSSFTQFLKLISEKLNIPDMIIGETPLKKREDAKERFQKGEIKQLLLNTQAGKEALTLDTAEVAIFLDMYPPFGDVDQAENRFTATTKDKKDKEHTIIHVMMEETYDEALFYLVRQRASETDIINNYKRYLKGGDAYDCQ